MPQAGAAGGDDVAVVDHARLDHVGAGRRAGRRGRRVGRRGPALEDAGCGDEHRAGADRARSSRRRRGARRSPRGISPRCASAQAPSGVRSNQPPPGTRSRSGRSDSAPCARTTAPWSARTSRAPSSVTKRASTSSLHRAGPRGPPTGRTRRARRSRRRGGSRRSWRASVPPARAAREWQECHVAIDSCHATHRVRRPDRRRGRRVRSLDPGAGVRPRARRSTTSPSARRAPGRCRPRPGSRSWPRAAWRRSRRRHGHRARASATADGRSPQPCSTRCARPPRAARGSSRSAPARSCWPPPGCSTGAARPRTGAYAARARARRSRRVDVDAARALRRRGRRADLGRRRRGDRPLPAHRAPRPRRRGRQRGRAADRRRRRTARAARRSSSSARAERRRAAASRATRAWMLERLARAAHRRRHGRHAGYSARTLRPPLPGRDRHVAAALAASASASSRRAGCWRAPTCRSSGRRARRLRHRGAAPALRPARPPTPTAYRRSLPESRAPLRSRADVHAWSAGL